MKQATIQPTVPTTEEAIAHWQPGIRAAIEREYAAWPTEPVKAPTPVETGH